MREITIKIDDKLYERLIKRRAYYEVVHEQSPIDPAIELSLAVIHGMLLPKGHKELIDSKILIEDINDIIEVRKENGETLKFDAQDIINLILCQNVLVEAEGENE